MSKSNEHIKDSSHNNVKYEKLKNISEMKRGTSLTKAKANKGNIPVISGGREYTDPKKLQVVTLENAIYMGMKNDLAFIMDMNLYFLE
mgnify:CR=1 FL=1